MGIVKGGLLGQSFSYRQQRKEVFFLFILKQHPDKLQQVQVRAGGHANQSTPNSEVLICSAQQGKAYFTSRNASFVVQ